MFLLHQPARQLIRLTSSLILYVHGTIWLNTVCCFVSISVMEASNFDLNNIVTPVQPDILQHLLEETDYDKDKTKYLEEGFKDCFKLNYQGPLKECNRKSPNLKLRVGSKIELWNKVMKEVELGRYAGPYENPPFDYFVQSPISLVPKDKGLKTRLIFHLSYPRNGDSVTSGIPKEDCSVKYPEFDEAVKLCLNEGVNCDVGKSDMSSAFRHVPMTKDQWWVLVMMAMHPITRQIFYFVDKCLPFGAAISCAIFQAVSDAIAWIVSCRTKKPNVNYLDDYLFAAALKAICDEQIQSFLQVCGRINFPVALEKTHCGTTILTFLRLLLDTERQIICIPQDKLIKASNWVNYFLNKKNKKATVKEFQKLCGILNFLCRCIVPGRAFLRRLYLNNAKLKPHHHVKISQENKLDLLVWKEFLTHPDSFYRPFMESVTLNAEEIDMFSDASGNFSLGFGAHCGPEWTYGKWNKAFCEKTKPSIEYLELFGVTVAVLNWIKFFANRRIVLFCDNELVVHMINGSSSKCKNCMVLIRIIVSESILQNARIYAKHVGTKQNGKADALSRLDFNRFWSLSPKGQMNRLPTSVPDVLWPMEKIWLY